MLAMVESFDEYRPTTGISKNNGIEIIRQKSPEDEVRLKNGKRLLDRGLAQPRTPKAP